MPLSMTVALDTCGPVTWQDGWAQMPFSAHPKLDPQGNLWVTLHFELMAQGKFGADAIRVHKSEALRIWVAPKDDISKAVMFELPHEMVFHVGNAYERTGASGTEVVMNYVGSRDDNFLSGTAVEIMRGVHAPNGAARMRTVSLNLATGKAQVSTYEELSEEFPRVDPRFIGGNARFVVTPASWRTSASASSFHGLQVRDVGSGKTTRFDYGENFTVEEHLVIARPDSTRELDGWIMGSAFDAKSQRTCVSIFDASNVNNGPLARAWLPYWLPLGKR